MKVFFSCCAAVLMWGMVSVGASAVNVATRDASQIVDQQQEVRAKVLSGKGAYKDMAPSERHDLLGQQELIFGLLDGKQSTSDLSPADQVKLFNAIEHVAALVNKAEDERLVCRREKKTGSNRPETICKTVAQLREEREEANKFMGGPRKANCVTACSGESMMPEGW